jgi:hypothetical protein
MPNSFDEMGIFFIEFPVRCRLVKFAKADFSCEVDCCMATIISAGIE